MYFHKDLIEARLRKLAESGRTGALRVPGDLGGAIYLRRGDVIFAASRRTPAPATSPVISPLDPGSGGSGPTPSAPAAADVGAFHTLARESAVREAIFDAVTELLSGRFRHVRFRPDETPAVADTAGMRLRAVCAEVARRRELLRQLSPLLTMDSPVMRNLDADSRSPQLSELQRALLLRVGPGTTSRSLALDLGHSVFATTLEVFRLVALGLLAARQSAAVRDPAAGEPRGQRPAISFLRAVIESADRAE